MVKLLRRREFGVLTAGSLAALALTAACGSARTEPSPDALEVADQLAESLRAVPRLTEVEAHVTTHVYTEPEIVASGTVDGEPDRDELLSLGHQVQAAVDGHQLAKHRVRTWANIALGATDVQWNWLLSVPETPTNEHQVDAIVAETDRGPSSLTVSDHISSTWDTIDDSAALHAAPAGMRLASRWLMPGTSTQITTTMHAGAPSLAWPLRTALEPSLPFFSSVNIVVWPDRAKWQLSASVAETSTSLFVDAFVDMLRLLREVDFAGLHTLDCSNPWGVTLQLSNTVTILEWRSEDQRSRAEAVVTGLLERVNA